MLNLQGDVIEIVESDGTVMASYTYDAWGNVLSSTGSLAAINPIRYRGYYYDSETGLYYLGSRYYDPAVKRFINADSASLITSNTYALTDKNLFAYCDNNPVSRNDKNGAFFNTVIGAVVGGVSAYLFVTNSGLSGKQIAATVLVGAGTGALGGFALDACIAIGGGFGVVVAAVGGAAASSVNTYASAKVQQKTVKETELLVDAAVGAASNALFGAYGRTSGRAV